MSSGTGTLPRRGFLSRSKSMGTLVSDANNQSTALLRSMEEAVRKADDAIAADDKAINEMDRAIAALKLETDRLERQITQEEAIVASMAPDKGIGNAMKNFDDMMIGVKQ